MATFNEQAMKMDFRGVIITSILTALALVVGLFWKDAITDTIDTIIPKGEGLFYKYLAAFIATVIVIIIAYILIKIQGFQIESLFGKKKKK